MTNHPNAPTERIEIVHPRRPFEEWIVDSPLPDTAQVVPNDVLLDPDSEEELRVGYSYTTRGDVETVGEAKNALEEGSMGSVDIDLEGYQCITRLRHTIRLVANRTDDDTEIPGHRACLTGSSSAPPRRRMPMPSIPFIAPPSRGPNSGIGAKRNWCG